MNIAFLGDISLNNRYSDMHELGFNPFSSVISILANQDHVIGNLECFAKGDKGENLLKQPRLNTSLNTLDYLKTIRVDAVELANNHCYDNLRDGFDKTISFLDNNRIAHLGASSIKGQQSVPLVFKDEECSVCLLNFVSKDTDPNLPIDADVYLNWFHVDTIIREIKYYKKCFNYVVLLFHWGGRFETGYYPDWSQISQARNFIDAGADLIIGNHSHTIQPFEIYREKYIFYSLGNFCFCPLIESNTINYTDSKRSKLSRIVFVTFGNNKLKISCKSTIIKSDLSLSVVNKSFKIRQIIFHYLKSNHFLWEIYKWCFNNIRPFVVALQTKTPIRILINKICNKI